MQQTVGQNIQPIAEQTLFRPPVFFDGQWPDEAVFPFAHLVRPAESNGEQGHDFLDTAIVGQIMNGSTTTAFPRKHWDIKPLFKHSRNGRKRSQIYSKRKYMIYRDLTLMHQLLTMAFRLLSSYSFQINVIGFVKQVPHSFLPTRFISAARTLA
ncbi:hypothetical protein [Thiothrix lacustris]|uniref:hypothetical protein n=1 Tax=Thiothrix lacustris TaxID=525917 RepID=UPI00355BD420